MRLTVYVDILIFVNVVVNTVILWLTARILRLDTKPLRLIGAVVLSVVYGFAVCLPQLAFLLNAFAKLLSGALIVFVAFGFVNIRKFIKTLCVFMAVSAAYIGCLLLLTLLPQTGDFIYVNNGEVYFDLPVVYILAVTVIVCIVQIVVERFFTKRMPKEAFCRCEIEFGGKSVSFNCLTDTGNRLVEHISGLPVVVVEEKLLRSVADLRDGHIPNNGLLYKRLRLIPYKGADGRTGILRGFLPDKFTVNGEEKKVVVACRDTVFDKNGEYRGVSPLF
ncbi:MAG: sigma-E processing peptidase SpoIIGA [Eubacteriales bacterium]|nr:sigma-E processing peptidase SpoIIGA [Clostridiales bacterium]MDD6341692.1 sigma-E processing peptidase SpoIIGA [Eubacteriales bacterium]MDD7393680.1 sigma-E processing peptidase SpoIIGA [Eubacteriales bacterium]MDY3760773.1 sigma-E processing peptidase SpoIIGA [Eubacteriales bacterium]